MANNAAAAYERAGEEPRELLGFLLRGPRLRGPRRSAAALAASWGVSGLLSTTGPGVAANRDHVLFYFAFLIVGVLLLLLDLASPDMPAAERAAERVHGWLVRAMRL